MQHQLYRQRGALRGYVTCQRLAGSSFRARDRSQFSSLATDHPGAQVWLIGIACCYCHFLNASH